MLNLTYLAVLEPGEDGSYSVSFPHLPGCFSYGDNLTEAQRMAEEAASLHVYGMERDGEEIPSPSFSLSKEYTEGNVVMPVTIHPDLYRAKRAVISIPPSSGDTNKWLYQPYTKNCFNRSPWRVPSLPLYRHEALP